MAKRRSRSDRLIDYCRGLPGVTEDVKWEKNLVFSVGEKMFAVFGLPDTRSMSFKVEPDLFEGLTQQAEFMPAPYLAKHDWVYVEDLNQLPAEMLEELLTDSHRLVSSKLSKKLQRSLGLID